MSAATRTRFAELLAEPDPDLAELNLLIAAEAYPRIDLTRWLGRVDALGLRADALGGGRDGVVAALRELDLRGDRATYDDPRNSYLHEVLDRRLGLPIALSALTVAAGRRAGVRLACVGMPGHVLVIDMTGAQPVYVDAFDDWAILSPGDCAEIARRTAGVTITRDDLAPTAPRTVVRRMLANLTASYARRSCHEDVRWTLELHRIAAPDDPVVAEHLRALDDAG